MKSLRVLGERNQAWPTSTKWHQGLQQTAVQHRGPRQQRQQHQQLGRPPSYLGSVVRHLHPIRVPDGLDGLHPQACEAHVHGRVEGCVSRHAAAIVGVVEDSVIGLWLAAASATHDGTNWHINKKNINGEAIINAAATAAATVLSMGIFGNETADRLASSDVDADALNELFDAEMSTLLADDAQF